MALKKEATEATERKENKVNAESNVKNDAEFCVYIGPTIVGAIQTITIYCGTKEEVLKEPMLSAAISKYPDIAELIVSGKTLATDRVKVKTEGEELYKAYRRLLKKK